MALTGPTFIGIGPMKSGSTSLYHYLKQHPEVFLSPLKNPKHFEADWDELPAHAVRSYTFDDHLAGRDAIGTRVTSPEEYRRFYEGAAAFRAAGEVSPSYLTHRGVAERVRRFDPKMKLIAVLRDPVARAYSQYTFLRSRGQETCGTFAEAIDREEVDEPLVYDEQFVTGDHPRSYVRQGWYARNLRAWLDAFPEDQVKVLLFEDLLDRPERMMSEIFAFLGVDPDFRPTDMSSFNPTRQARSGVVGKLAGRVPGGGAIRKILPRGMTAFLRRARDRMREKNLEAPPPLAANDRARLLPVFREDTLALQEMLGRDLSAWLT